MSNNALAELKQIEKYVDKKVGEIKDSQKKIEMQVDKSKEENFERICDDILDLFQYSNVLMTEVPAEGYAKDKDGNDQYFYSFVKPSQSFFERFPDTIAITLNGRTEHFSATFNKSKGYRDLEEEVMHKSNMRDLFKDWSKTYDGIIRATQNYMIHAMKEKIRISEEDQKYWEKQYKEYCE